jgi:hypothetical protein
VKLDLSEVEAALRSAFQTLSTTNYVGNSLTSRRVVAALDELKGVHETICKAIESLQPQTDPTE